MLKLRVVAGFPGVGKSTLFRADPASFSDSDSSLFDKAAFPDNYIKHIKSVLETTNRVVFVSTHKVVREALAANGIPYLLIYPDQTLKSDFMQRYKQRGSPQPFLDLMNANFDSFVQECKDCVHDTVTHYCMTDIDKHSVAHALDLHDIY